MAWISLQFDPSKLGSLDKGSHPLDGTLRGIIYLDYPGGEEVRFNKLSPAEKFSTLKTLKGFKDLKPDIIGKLSRSTDQELKRIIELWRGIEDCFLISTPELAQSKRIPLLIKRLWRWAISSGIHNVDHTTRIWKRLMKYIELTVYSCEHNDVAKAPREVPGIIQGRLGPIWFKCLPWLGAMHRGALTKFTVTRLVHFTTSRNLPAPSISSEDIKREFLLFQSRVCRNPQVSDLIVNGLIKTAELLSESHERERKFESRAHISISFSGSLSGIRSEGGRMKEFSKSFKTHFVDKPQLLNLKGETWFGGQYWLMKGFPKWKTMCRSSAIGEKYKFLDAFDDLLISNLGNQLNLAETHVGIDSQMGYQVLQWSIEEAIASGCLQGSPYKDMDNPLSLGETLPHVRTGLIGEPGAKYRTITIAPAWLTILLTPLGHDLITMLQSDTYCVSGLKKEKQGWRFSNDLYYSNFELNDTHLILKGDLKTASDMMSHKLTRSMLYAYLHKRGQLTTFYKTCVDLLTCGRYVECPRNFPNEEFLSTSGVLMGDPGCKGALTLTVLCARTLTRAIENYNGPEIPLSDIVNRDRTIQYSSGKDYFGRSAGDDFCEIGSLSYLQTLKTLLEATGCIVGTNWLSRNFTTYCEEAILIRIPGRSGQLKITRASGDRRRFYQLDYQESSYVDALKLRLLSPCGKVSLGVTGQIENPAMGKGILFRNMLDTLPPPLQGFEVAFRKRWVFRMCNYINCSEVMTFLDRRMGGLGIPFHRSYSELAVRFFNSKWINNENYLRVMSSYQSSDHAWVTRIINKLHKGCLSRGFSTSLSDEAWAVYTLLAKSKLKLIELEGLPFYLSHRNGFQTAWDNSRRFRDKLNLARRNGFIADGEAQRLIEKGWVLKQGLLDPGGLHNPNKRRRREYATMEDELRNLDPEITNKLPILEDPTASKRFLCEIICGTEEYPTVKTLMISEDALLANFSGLLTPMPAKKLNMAYCSGQEIDVQNVL
jgi:hypothetical protein